MLKYLLKILGDPNEKKVKSMMGVVEHINALEIKDFRRSQ